MLDGRAARTVAASADGVEVDVTAKRHGQRLENLGRLQVVRSDWRQPATLAAEAGSWVVRRATPNHGRIAVLAAGLCAVLGAFTAMAGPATGAPAATNDPTVRWAVPVGEVDAAEDEVDGIGIAPDGSTVVSGVFRGRVRFGDTTFTSRGSGGSVSADWRCARFDSCDSHER